VPLEDLAAKTIQDPNFNLVEELPGTKGKKIWDC
jgi:hypothetical protein